MPPKDVGCMPRKLYSPECVEKLFGNSQWVPNRGYESGQEGSKESRSAASWRHRSALETPSELFSKQFRKMNSRKFAVASGLSTQWQVLDNRPWRTPLGSKRLRLGSSSCTSLYQGVATRSGATTREILVHRAGPLQTHTTP